MSLTNCDLISDILFVIHHNASDRLAMRVDSIVR